MTASPGPVRGTPMSVPGSPATGIKRASRLRGPGGCTREPGAGWPKTRSGVEKPRRFAQAVHGFGYREQTESDCPMVTLGDVERAIAASDPQLGELIVRYLGQGDPEDGRSELAPTAGDEGGDDDGEEQVVDVPPGAVTLDRLSAAVSPRGLANKTATERKLARREAFAAAEASPFAPPRLRLGKLLIELYERGDAVGPRGAAPRVRRGHDEVGRVAGGEGDLQARRGAPRSRRCSACWRTGSTRCARRRMRAARSARARCSTCGGARGATCGCSARRCPTRIRRSPSRCCGTIRPATSATRRRGSPRRSGTTARSAARAGRRRSRRRAAAIRCSCARSAPAWKAVAGAAAAAARGGAQRSGVRLGDPVPARRSSARAARGRAGVARAARSPAGRGDPRVRRVAAARQPRAAPEQAARARAARRGARLPALAGGRGAQLRARVRRRARARPRRSTSSSS